MAAPLQITEAQWAMYKPIIEMEYLTKNHSAKEVQRYLETHYNLSTTVRRLKIKFESWKWDKKIAAPNYAAMTRVVQDLGQQIIFTVPKMGGRMLWCIDGKKVVKETNRKKTTHENKGRTHPPVPDLHVAHSILREAGITFERRHTTHTQPRLAPSGTQNTSNWPMTMGGLTKYPTGRSNNDDEDDYDDDEEDEVDDNRSNASDDSTPDEPMPDADTDMVQDSCRELNSQNFPPDLRLTRYLNLPTRAEDSTQPRMTGVLPFTDAYLADLHCNIFPSIPEYKLACPSITIARHHQGSPGLVTDPDFLPSDYTDHLGLNSGPELPASQRIFREKLIEETLIDYYHRCDQNNHKSMALGFSAYYVMHVLAGHDRLDDLTHVDRMDARHRLCVMLEQNNMQLLTHCYWVSSMIMSYDRIRLLLGFFDDCIDCIDTSTSYVANILRPWIRLMILNHREFYLHYVTQSPRLTSAALQQMATNFDASKQLEESMDCLNQHGHQGSHTHLILRLYHAWDLCHQGDPRGGIYLLDCLPLAEAKFGIKHLVTINCLSMVARAYEKLDSPIFAKIYVDTAISRFKPCSKMLASRLYQLQVSSAQLLLAEGNLPEAREKLEYALQYRLQHLGAQAPMTWDAAEMVFDVMSRQGFGHEVQQRRAELQARFEAEWRKYPIEPLPRPMMPTILPRSTIMP